MKPFSLLPLNNEMMDNLKSLNYEIMTDIQENSIPPILKGLDIFAQAKTGSGKTAAFGIGLMHKLNVKKYRIQALVLCPTRELAEQVTAELRRIARFQHNIKILKITGGMPLYRQEHSLKHEAHIVVGTPGRIAKLLSRGSLVLTDLQTVVLDEADRMLDMGFIDQINEIFMYTPTKRQTLCFSATFSDEVKKLGRSLLNDPVEVTVESHVKPNEEFRLNEINEFTGNSFKSKDINLAAKIEMSNMEPSFITLSINGGRKNKISPGDILGALTVKNGISGKDVGRIDRQDNITFVAVKRDVFERAFSLLENGKIKGRKFKAMIND